MSDPPVRSSGSERQTTVIIARHRWIARVLNVDVPQTAPGGITIGAHRMPPPVPEAPPEPPGPRPDEILEACRIAHEAQTAKLAECTRRLAALPAGQMEIMAALDLLQRALAAAEQAIGQRNAVAAPEAMQRAVEAADHLLGLLEAAERKLEADKRAYEQALAAASAVIAEAKAGKPATDAADASRATMLEALATMEAAAGERRYSDAQRALAAAEDAAKQVVAERDKAKASFERAFALSEQAFAAAAGKHTAKPAIDRATLDLKKAAEDAKAAAEKARGENDWRAANAAIQPLNDAIKAFDDAYAAEWRIRGETAATRADLARRAGAKSGLTPIGAAQIKAKNHALAALKKLDGLLDKDPASAAAAQAVLAESAVATLEGMSGLGTSQKAALSSTAAARLKGMDDTQLGALSLQERAELAFDLIAGGNPSGDARTQLHRLYDKTGMDPAFLAKRKEVRKQTAQQVIAQLPESEDMRDNWDIKPESEKRAYLRKVQEQQSTVLGIPDVPLNFFSQPATGGSITFGEYLPSTRAIRLNSHPDGMPNFFRAVATILHENSHAQQHVLIDRLYAGEIQPDDPDFAQVLMFAVNNEDNGYVPSSVGGQTLYAKQPIEEDAWRQGDEGARTIEAMIDGTFVDA